MNVHKYHQLNYKDFLIWQREVWVTLKMTIPIYWFGANWNFQLHVKFGILSFVKVHQKFAVSRGFRFEKINGCINED